MKLVKTGKRYITENIPLVRRLLYLQGNMLMEFQTKLLHGKQ